MKILITHELFPPEIVGGGETLTYKIAKELIDKGFEVKVLTTGDPKIKFYENIETIRIPINRYLMNFSYPLIKKYARNVDLIHTSSGNMCFPSFLAAKVCKKPICCYVHHIFGFNWVYVRGPFAGRIFQLAERFFMTRDFDAVIFQNDLSMNIGLSMGVSKQKSFIIHPGIDYQNYQLNLERKNQVLFVGSLSMDKNMIKIKGLEYFIEAAKRLPETKFLIAGGSKYLESVKLPENVVFLKAKNKEELAKIYNESLVFCKPSLAEGFGLSLLEAMASGCAIVSTIDIGQKGKIVKPMDVSSLTKAIKYYIENPDIAKKEGEENRKIAKSFTWKKFIDDLIKIYEYIISKK